MKKLGLLPRIAFGIVIGILLGLTKVEILTRIPMTFTSLFGELLNYFIPLLIIAFIAPGIAELGTKAGKLLGITAGLSYLSTVIAGVLAFFVGTFVLPMIIPADANIAKSAIEIAPIFELEITPIMGVMTALVTAFLLGLGIAVVNGKTLFNVVSEFQSIIEKVIEKIIIPLLPLYIVGIFSKMAYTGEVFKIMSIFGKVFILVVALHIFYLMVQYLIAGSISKKNPVSSLRNMVPAYLTAIGTQSSAATIPVTAEMSKKNGITDKIVDFVIPLCSTIHLSGSTITLTLCALAVMFINGVTPSFQDIFPFILMLGVTMIAAPGVPGGAVMAALGLLSTMLGFTEANLGLMMALYMAQDSFGTATNITGDGAIAMIVDKFSIA